MNVRTFYVGALLVAGALPLMAPLTRIAGSTPSAAASSVLRAAPGSSAHAAVEWPTTFRHQPLTQLALTPLEERFAQRFPGAIARFTDGDNVLTLRHVTRPTRQLHPATDCFRALGYEVTAAKPMVDVYELTWSCFAATRDGRRVRVCERIHDDVGAAWTDTSAWFWAAQYGGGPWWAVTVVTPES